MSRSELYAILAKAKSEAYPLGVWLYNYTEPFLHPNLPEMVRTVHSFDLPCYISTNFNIGRNIREVLAEEPSALMVSLSGFTQPVYSIGHHSGDVDKVKENILYASKVRSNTVRRIHWHRYKHNEHELPLMKEWVSRLPCKWQFHDYKAVRIPMEDVIRRLDGTLGPNHEEAKLLSGIDSLRKKCKDRIHYKCQVQEGTCSIGANGNFRLCCSYYRSGTDRHYLDTPINDLLSMRSGSDLCRKCLAHGGHVYAMELYDAPVRSFRIMAEEMYRRIPARGRFRKLFEVARNLQLAARPE